MNTATLEGNEMLITSQHVERGRQMREVVRHDIVSRGLSFEAAVESLAEYLGVEVDTVRLGIAIANDADNGSPIAKGARA